LWPQVSLAQNGFFKARSPQSVSTVQSLAQRPETVTPTPASMGPQLPRQYWPLPHSLLALHDCWPYFGEHDEKEEHRGEKFAHAVN